jgi:LacI family transcriptional regulator
MHPDRPKLADHLAQEIQRGITAGRWREWLPQERMLAAELKASRATVRQALALLRHAGWCEIVPRKGTRLAPRRSRAGRAAKTTTVNLVLPGPADDVRPTIVHWVDELRALLAAKHWTIRIVEAKACYSNHPRRALEDLFARSPADCWLVRLSTPPMQRWLAASGQPVVIAGSCHVGIDLPHVDIDHRAVSRHATGVLLAARHQRLLLLIDAGGKAGDLESERGFHEATAHHPHVRATIARHDGTAKSVAACIDRALRSAEPPTALLVTQPVYCLTVWSCLAARGLRIPGDISVLAQVGAPYLAYLLPEPAAYRVNQRVYAQTILRALAETMSARPTRREYLILPDFVSRGSVAAPRA